MNIPYRLGDVVEFVGKDRFWKKGERHIIHDVTIDTGSLQYSTNQGAWFSHNEFKLLEPCSAKSLRALKRSLCDE